MKRALIAIGLSLWALTARASQPANLADANALYRQGNFTAAIAAYQEFLASRPSPAVYFNLGNAYFKEGSPGSLGRAIAAYLRAYEAAPRDPDIRHNLEFALRRAGETLVPPGTPRALYRLYRLLSWNELLGLQWIGYWACLILGSLYLLRPGSRHSLQVPLLAALAFWALAGSWLALRYATAVSGLGVVLEPSAEARSGPGTNFPVSFNAPEGRRVSILGESGGWVEIGVLKEGLKGWTQAKNVERI